MIVGVATAEQEELKSLSGLLEEHFGLRFTSMTQDLIQAGLRLQAQQLRLTRRALINGLLAGDAELLHGLVRNTVVSETYFFRHPEHFAALAEHVVPSLLRSGQTSLRAWSAGCATGEEAYSLAATLVAAAPLADISVLGTDVNEDSLAVAAAGRYGPRSLRGELPSLAMSWPLVVGPRGVEIPAPLLRLLRFCRLNLHQAHYPDELVPPASFDIIFCRNVLVYFTAEAARNVLLRLRDRLREGGYLFLAALDYSGAPPGLEQVQVGGVSALRRKSRAVESSPRPRPAVASPPRPPQDPMPAAKAAADSGDYSLAGRLIRDALIAQRTPELLHLLALVAKESGRFSETLALLTEATTVEPKYALGHLSLGLITLRPPLRDKLQARRHLERVLELLAGRSDSELLPGPEPLAVGLARAMAVAGLRQLQEEQ